jgi:hypothetical protein
VLLLTVCGLVLLVTDVVLGPGWAYVAAGLALVLFLGLWVLAPLGLARFDRFPRNPPPHGTCIRTDGG